jgi:hypothetical protein
MAIEFIPVAKEYGNTFNYDDEFVSDFMTAWNYLSVNPTHYLQHDFPDAKSRDEWLAKAKAYGRQASPETITVRRIKRTGSSDPNSGHLSFTMEATSVAAARHARLRAEQAERERRKANGEELRRGKRHSDTAWQSNAA